MAKTIGTITTYDGDEHPYLRGHRVRVVGVMKGAATSDDDPDREGSYLRDEEDVVGAGGISADDASRFSPGSSESSAGASSPATRARSTSRASATSLGSADPNRPVTTPGGPAAAPGTTTKEPDMNDATRRTLESLAKLRLPELQARFAEIVGEKTRSPNRTFLLRKIGEALEAREQQTDTEPTTPATTTTEASPNVKLTKLSVAELQAMYREVVGRETRSSDSAYLVWKLRQAQKGRIRVGPIERRSGGTSDAKVLPLRMTASEVEALDEAWRRLGFKSRAAFLRDVLMDRVEMADLRAERE